MGFHKPQMVEVERQELVRLRQSVDRLEEHLAKHWTPEISTIALEVQRMKQQLNHMLGLDRERHECMD